MNNITNKGIKRYTISQVLHKIPETLSSAVMTLYLLSKNLSFTQVGILFTIYLLVAFIFEYPSGGWSDKYGRKKIYMYGVFITLISYILIFSNNLYALIISYSLKGLSSSMISGSLITWLRSESINEQQYKNILSTAKLIQSITVVVISLLIVVFDISSFTKIIYIMILTHICILLSLIKVQDNYGSPNKNVLQISKDALIDYIKNKKLIHITFINVIVYIYFTIFIFSWQPTAALLETDSKYFPMIYSITVLSSGISSMLFKKVKIELQSYLIIIVNICFLISFLTFYLSLKQLNIYYLIIGMYFFGFAQGIVFLLITTLIARYSKEEFRSSQFSLIFAFSSAINLVLQPIFGYLVDLYSISILFKIGIVMSLTIVVILVLFNVITMLCSLFKKTKLQ